MWASADSGSRSPTPRGWKADGPPEAASRADAEGLTIIEPPTRDGTGRTDCQVVNLANWTDENLTSLAPHEPLATGERVAL